MSQKFGWEELKEVTRDGFIQGTKEFFQPVRDPRFWIATVLIGASMAVYDNHPDIQKVIDQDVRRDIDSTKSTLSEFGKAMKRAVETGQPPHTHVREASSPLAIR